MASKLVLLTWHNEILNQDINSKKIFEKNHDSLAAAIYRCFKEELLW